MSAHDHEIARPTPAARTGYTRISEATLRAFFLGVSEAHSDFGMTYDVDPESERSRAYDLGRSVGEKRKALPGEGAGL